MATTYHFNTNRYELKFLIEESCARGVRDFVRSRMVHDPHAQPAMAGSYANFSLYLDGPELPLYSATMQGQKNRYKLRLRYYDDDPTTPTFFEIKRRVADVILKERAAVTKDAALRLIRGGWPHPNDLSDPANMGDFSTVRRFCELRDAIHAQPRLVLYFEREAWIDPKDEQLRVTFDRESNAALFDGTLYPKRFKETKFPGVILELKFTDRFPTWMRELTRSFDLYRTNMAKYVHCTDLLPKNGERLSRFAPMR
jgi:SPX domain protein involved in polyphosphate accumulation